MNRIAQLERGLQQTHGEALELGLESMLKNAFPMEEIQPVPGLPARRGTAHHARSMKSPFQHRSPCSSQFAQRVKSVVEVSKRCGAI
jgi:hypothetical protein